MCLPLPSILNLYNFGVPQEIREEIDDHGKEIQDAHNVALGSQLGGLC